MNTTSNHHRCSQHTPELLGQLTANDFQSGVFFAFEDGTLLYTPYGFSTVEARGTLRVLYTEHCGYHVFLRSQVTVWGDDRLALHKGKEHG